jgi:hypothetical protein
MTEDSHHTTVSSAWRRHRAARTVACHARDAAELTELLDMLALTAEEGRAEPVEEPPPPPRRPIPRLDRSSACRIDNLRRDGRHPR